MNSLTLPITPSMHLHALACRDKTPKSSFRPAAAAASTQGSQHQEVPQQGGVPRCPVPFTLHVIAAVLQQHNGHEQVGTVSTTGVLLLAKVPHYTCPETPQPSSNHVRTAQF